MVLLLSGVAPQFALAAKIIKPLPALEALDSIKIIVGKDTLLYPKLYMLELPLYTENMDSTVTDKGKIPEIKDAKSGIAATGSISRGIQVSSNASVSLQSSMYLKIRGNLSQNYTVSGVLTEKTSPLQPIGNTRRLNDFDRVLVSISGPLLQASIGDIDLKLTNGQFGNMERSIEGLQASLRTEGKSMHAALGFSYGKYHLQPIQGKDGKQGPYRLIGKNGEKFIIILAGSEKVKLDDKLLQRGQNDDYIIDYNAAEIVFTQSNILSSNSRISVEFEYVPDIYLASYSFGKQMMSSSVAFGDSKSSSLYASASWQALQDDARNPLGNIDADLLKDIFIDLADTVGTTSRSSIQLDSLNGSYILAGDGTLEYTGQGEGTHSANFNFVGLANGSYRKVLEAATEYFVLDSLKGEYSPTQSYFAPQSHSVFTLVAGTNLGMFNIHSDFGFSRRVENLYAQSTSSSLIKAWDIQAGLTGGPMSFMLGNKFLEKGFESHDVIESIEYYRRWGIHPRVNEEETLNYGQIRLGRIEGMHLESEANTLSREGLKIGRQLHVNAQNNSTGKTKTKLSSYFMDLDGEISQQHNLNTGLEYDRISTSFNLSMEEGTGNSAYQSNDHVKAGLELGYSIAESQKFTLQYDQRLDYQQNDAIQSFLSLNNIRTYHAKREDWSAKYQYSNILNSKGNMQFKYREHSQEAASSSKYYLGKFKIDGSAVGNRIRFNEYLLIDEEHIPRYDYHYVEVDTGYGDFSFDPFIEDYIPVSGGRFIRQRIFSDIEEQVRKYENKTKLEFISQSYSKKDRGGFKSRLNSELRTKLRVQDKQKIQDQQLLVLDLIFKTRQRSVLSEVSYKSKRTKNTSLLYNYGAESSGNILHELLATMKLSPKAKTSLGFSSEGRKREIAYNTLATEDWSGFRPSVLYQFEVSESQKFELLYKYSRVEDSQRNLTYLESYWSLDHHMRIKRRGRIDQKLSLSSIQAEVDAIPYSVFSGRQPGDNLKYTVNSRYIFSNRFQLILNYSHQKRGSSGSEQFFRLEGRTHF